MPGDGAVASLVAPGATGTATSVLKAAVADRAHSPATARKLEREFEALAQDAAGLRTELQNRVLAEANALGYRNRAEKIAEREIDEQDQEALAGLEDWRRGKAAEQLADSRARRIEQHAEVVHERLWEQAEAKVGARLLNPGTGAEPTEMPAEIDEGEDAG